MDDLSAVNQKLNTLLGKVETIMATLNDAQAAVAALQAAVAANTAEQSKIIATLTAQHTELVAALAQLGAGTTDPAALQGIVDNIGATIATLQANTTAAQQAEGANPDPAVGTGP